MFTTRDYFKDFNYDYDSTTALMPDMEIVVCAFLS